MNAIATEEMIERAGRALIDAASAPAKVILFGSVDDHIIGFHAQQAVEKALKVCLLVLADSELPPSASSWVASLLQTRSPHKTDPDPGRKSREEASPAPPALMEPRKPWVSGFPGVSFHSGAGLKTGSCDLASGLGNLGSHAYPAT